MKRWFVSVACSLVLVCAPAVTGQDAATEERLNKLSGQIEDLIVAQKAQQKQISELIREIQDLKDGANRPNQNYATHDDLRALAESVKEVDRKRVEDARTVQNELQRILKEVTAATSKPVRRQEEPSAAANSLPEKYFEYMVASGDTLSIIVQAYRRQNIKVTVESILKANPGLKPERLQVGQKLIIPAP